MRTLTARVLFLAAYLLDVIVGFLAVVWLATLGTYLATRSIHGHA